MNEDSGKNTGNIWQPTGCSTRLHLFLPGSLCTNEGNLRFNLKISKMGMLIPPTSEAYCISQDDLQKTPSTVPAVTIKWYMSLLLL